MYVISQFTDHDNTTTNTFVVKLFLFIEFKIKITLYNPDSTTEIKMILQLDILVCKNKIPRITKFVSRFEQQFVHISICQLNVI